MNLLALLKGVSDFCQEQVLGESDKTQIYNWPISKEQSLKRLAYNEKVSNYIEGFG